MTSNYQMTLKLHRLNSQAPSSRLLLAATFEKH